MPYFVQSPTFGAAATLQVFEAAYHEHNKADGYWGPVASSIDWCERNYAVTPYVAEWWNTVSNVVLVVFSLVGILTALRFQLETRFVVAYGACFLVGIGSGLFHGTLTHLGQQGDETPMVWAMCCWIYCMITMDPVEELRNRVAMTLARAGLIGFGAVFAVVHFHLRFVLTFQVLFFVLTIVATWLMVANIRRCDDPTARRLGIGFIGFSVAGFALWLIDQLLCETMYSLPFGLPNPQFHAWWHALTAAACYVGPTFLVFRRATLTGRHPGIAWRFGIPVVIPESPSWLDLAGKSTSCESNA